MYKQRLEVNVLIPHTYLRKLPEESIKGMKHADTP